MALSNVSVIFLLVFVVQGIIISHSKPTDWACGLPFAGCGGCCCPAPAPAPSISFSPVPQPIPVKIPAACSQSVTIPNIILALLPPTNKAPAVKPCPLPVPKPQPIVIPIPQPYPVTVPDCGCP